jgi:hypothetical protein
MAVTGTITITTMLYLYIAHEMAGAYLSADAAESFCLPRDRTLIMGSRIEV